MQQKITLRLLPAESEDNVIITEHILKQSGKTVGDLSGFEITRKSIDARGKQVYINLHVLAIFNEPGFKKSKKEFHFHDVSNAKETAIIIGAGPAGLFAALSLIEAGIKPIILERGKDVKARRRDLALLNKEGIINPESNYCFGEGGAGTYSDGKLYTRSNKRGNIDRILQLFVHFGATENILWDAHPHIGTNKLPQIITAMREFIIASGGNVLFEKKVTDLDIRDAKLKSVSTSDGSIFEANAFILATGHSARDIFVLLKNKNVLLEAKPFALGVRVEHPQSLIDKIQYHGISRGIHLPPASYSLVQQVNGTGVFSFCMCPGGIIAPAATSPGELVVNGWSPSKRNNPFANSGMVVPVTIEDALKATTHLDTSEDDPLLFMHFQQCIEQKAFDAGGGKFTAPAQRMCDFSNGKHSASLPENSYIPGLASTDLKTVLPLFIFEALAKGFKSFGKKMKGYYTNDAVVVATESRTSSPVRIPRDATSLMHPFVEGLYPCGEGAGYAGGIVSAAMDGENVAMKIKERFSHS